MEEGGAELGEGGHRVIVVVTVITGTRGTLVQEKVLLDERLLGGEGGQLPVD